MDILFSWPVVFLAGLLIGWNVLPQPVWAQRLWTWLTSLFKPAA